MKTLLIDENGVMYWALPPDIEDLRAGIRRPPTVLSSLERVGMYYIPTDEFERREYVDFLCKVEANSRKYNKVKMMKGGRLVNAYRYLQRLSGFRTDVAAMIEVHKYIIPIADAVEYTLGLIDRAGLMRRMRMRDPALHKVDRYGVTNFLIVS